MEDLRLALELGDSYLGQVPLIAGGITNSRFLDTPGMEELYDSSSAKLLTNGIAVPNGVNGAVNGGGLRGFDLSDPMVLDEEVTWQGGSVKDVEELDSALDSVLELGNI